MILRTDFVIIDGSIRQAVENAFNQLRNANLNNYLLLLADAEYKAEYDTQNSQLNPHIIENKMDWYRDESRLRFLADFMTAFYPFPVDQLQTDDHPQRLHMELMVYTHIWESKSFLKKLYRFAHLLNDEDYPWTVSIPDMGKHDFIRNDIRQVLQDIGNPLADIIRNGFHTSLRNAFAHSEYFFDTMNSNRRIILDNYNGAGWELDQISFDDWSKRFVHSALLSYYLFYIAHSKRQSLIVDLGTDVYTINLPRKQCGLMPVNIRYRPEQDAFGFQPQ